MPRFSRARCLNLLDQLQHLRRRRAAIIDDKIAVHFRDARFANRAIFQTQFVDQFSRRTCCPDS